ncbi:MAG: formylglycine-generating enzyme family protein [Planctomycetes bacterium]|nr:formylglycine-generating enzyme family protein [Planctomycetota bacterium]
MMGSPENEPGRDGDEGPRHRVTLKSFLIGKYEVTQRQWQAVMGNNPSHFKNAGLDAPVEQVSWDACKHFCEKTGLRLPSEAEWEYACRAGTTTAIYTGALTIKGERNGPELDDIAWYSGNSGVTYEGGYDSSAWIERQHNHTRSGTHPVGQKKPNAWGLHDTLGNVWEWCEDTLYASYNGAPTDGSAWISNESGYRVVRGGSWYDYARNLRAADRPGGAPGYRYYSSGFRASASVSPR